MEEDVNVIEGNKIIAAFMEWYFEPAFSDINSTRHDRWITPYSPSWIITEQMVFHSSWDWIMPVYFKFRDLVITNEVLFIQHDYWIKKVVEAMRYGDVSDNPSKAFVRLVEAITWHNNQQSK